MATPPKAVPYPVSTAPKAAAGAQGADPPKGVESHGAQQHLDFESLSKLATVAAIGGAAAFIYLRYRVAKPNEFLAWTGPGINGVKVSGRHWGVLQPRALSLD